MSDSFSMLLFMELDLPALGPSHLKLELLQLDPCLY